MPTFYKASSVQDSLDVLSLISRADPANPAKHIRPTFHDGKLRVNLQSTGAHADDEPDFMDLDLDMADLVVAACARQALTQGIWARQKAVLFENARDERAAYVEELTKVSFRSYREYLKSVAKLDSMQEEAGERTAALIEATASVKGSLATLVRLIPMGITWNVPINEDVPGIDSGKQSNFKVRLDELKYWFIIEFEDQETTPYVFSGDW